MVRRATASRVVESTLQAPTGANETHIHARAHARTCIAASLSVNAKNPARGHMREPPGHKALCGQGVQASLGPYAQLNEAGSDALEQAPDAASVNPAAAHDDAYTMPGASASAGSWSHLTFPSPTEVWEAGANAAPLSSVAKGTTLPPPLPALIRSMSPAQNGGQVSVAPRVSSPPFSGGVVTTSVALPHLPAATPAGPANVTTQRFFTPSVRQQTQFSTARTTHC